MLEGLKVQSQTKETGDNRIGIGMDSCIIPLKNKGLSLVQTTDFFYPLVDDPYIQGRITCANVLSDLYATGVTDCDNMLMLLGVARKMSQKERDVAVTMMMKGFRDLALEAGTQIEGGQTVINPWMTMGGVATSVVGSEDLVMPNGLEAGDVLLLTKPLGTQVAVNLHQWIEQPDWWSKVDSVVTAQQAEDVYQQAMYSMARLNRNGAALMKKYGAHGGTDVTGFGLLGHAQNLAKIQKKSVSLTITKLPIFQHMAAVSNQVNHMFKLLKGLSAETSGGLLIGIPADKAQPFIDEIYKLDRCEAWIIGHVSEGDHTAQISENPEIIEATGPTFE